MSAPDEFTRRFDARAWLLFGEMAVLWGIPYLLIKIVVESYSPVAMVAGRTLIAAVLLLPFALRTGALRPALRRWPWVLAFAALEMAAAFLLLGHAEQTLASGVTGLLVTTVPLFGAVIAFSAGERGALRPLRVLGLVIGFGAVAIVVAGPGLAVQSGSGLLAAGEVLLVAVCYAVAPFIVVHKLRDVPTLGTITVSLAAVGIAYLPFALLVPHPAPTVVSTVALVALGVLCTAVAFLVFFALIARVGPARAPLFTYVNPVVAVALGALVLAEPVTPGLLVGFPLVIVGCWLAATGGALPRRRGRAQRSTSTSTIHAANTVATMAVSDPAASSSNPPSRPTSSSSPPAV